jgi:hypothetical protein
MLFRPEKVPMLLKAKEKAFTGAFVGLALLVSGGWIYLLVSMLWRFVDWCFS